MFYSVIYIPTIVQSLLHTFSTWFLLEANINVLFCNIYTYHCTKLATYFLNMVSLGG